MPRATWGMKWGLTALAIVGMATSAGSAMAQFGPPPGGPDGPEVLTRGPIHEAFAEPIVYDPRPTPPVPKEPPPPVEETSPDERPEGANVQWIPGYWAWDDSRNDYLWISGLWRDVPPGRQWVPGYWGQAEGGFRWVPGTWASAAEPEASYFATPPDSLEVGPNSPPPSPSSVWSPGYWDWQGDRFAWRPGFWVDYHPNWVWVPAHYVWTPNGCLFVEGYWDLPVARRGTPFAPVYFAPTPVVRPRLFYTPTITLATSALMISVFVRPSHHQYCFGDYYGESDARAGAVPWYAFHQGRRGYDPLFAHYSAAEGPRDPRWFDRMRDDYRSRSDHPEFRPPHTYVEQQTIVNRTTINNTTINNIHVTNVRNVAVARPIAEVAAHPDHSARFTKVDPARRRELDRQAEQFREVRAQRSNQERPAARPQEGPERRNPDRVAEGPRRAAPFRSPVTSPVALSHPSPRPDARPHRDPAEAARGPRPHERPEQPKAQNPHAEPPRAARPNALVDRPAPPPHPRQDPEQLKRQQQHAQAEQAKAQQHLKAQAEQAAKAQQQQHQQRIQAEQAAKTQQQQRAQAEQQARAQQQQRAQAEQARIQQEARQRNAQRQHAEASKAQHAPPPAHARPRGENQEPAQKKKKKD